jgi:hypothetical protein
LEVKGHLLLLSGFGLLAVTIAEPDTDLSKGEATSLLDLEGDAAPGEDLNPQDVQDALELIRVSILQLIA